MSAATRAPVTIAVDANGADDPDAVQAAVLEAAGGPGRLRILVFDPREQLRDAEALAGCELADAPISIAKDPDPVRAVRSTPEASIVQAARAVADGRADALVAGGTTGAALAAGLFEVKRAKGIHRPALALPLPIPGRAPVVLIDVGANDAVRPEHLVQFAHMGAALSSTVLGVERPRVGLLANGTEPGKGRDETVAAHAALAERRSDRFAFAGNVEGFGVTAGEVDVVVTDGFTGNVALKLIEGTSQTMIGLVRRAAESSPRATAGGLLLRPALRGLRDEIDPEGVGGAYLLGLRRLVVVPHGSFGAEGFRQAIVRAERGVREDVVGRTHAALEAAGALRRAPPSGTTASV